MKICVWLSEASGIIKGLLPHANIRGAVCYQDEGLFMQTQCQVKYIKDVMLMFLIGCQKTERRRERLL